MDSPIFNTDTSLILLSGDIDVYLAQALLSSRKIVTSPSFECISFTACAVPSLDISSTQWCVGIVAHAFNLASLTFIDWGCQWASEATLGAFSTSEGPSAVLVKGLDEISSRLALAVAPCSVVLHRGVIALQASRLVLRWRRPCRALLASRQEVTQKVVSWHSCSRFGTQGRHSLDLGW